MRKLLLAAATVTASAVIALLLLQSPPPAVPAPRAQAIQTNSQSPTSRVDLRQRTTAQPESSRSIAAPPDPLRDSDAGPAIEALQSAYPSPQEKHDTVISQMSVSGPPSAELARDGAQMAEFLSHSHIAESWHCYRSGCYFDISTSAPMDITPTFLQAREHADSQYIMVITPEPAPNRLAVLLAFKQ